MYFSFFKLKKWGKKTAEARRHNCAVLPLLGAEDAVAGVAQAGDDVGVLIQLFIQGGRYFFRSMLIQARGQD